MKSLRPEELYVLLYILAMTLIGIIYAIIVGRKKRRLVTDPNPLRSGAQPLEANVPLDPSPPTLAGSAVRKLGET